MSTAHQRLPMIPKVSLIVGIGVLVLGALVAQIVYQQQKLLGAHRWVVHTMQVQEMGNRLVTEVLEASTAVRGYLLTANPNFLKGYQHLADVLLGLHAELSELTKDNPAQQQHLQALHPVLQQRLQFNRLIVESHVNSNITDKLALINDSEQINQHIKELIANIRAEENRLLIEREALMQQSAFWTLVWNVAMVSLLAIIAVFLTWSLRRQWQQRKQLLDELARLNSELANRNANLAIANEAISGADRLKTEFLSAMSHELRTPLNSIIGFAGILRMGIAGALNDEQKKQLNMVNDSAQHLLHLINDLLDLSRIESGRAELSDDQFDLREVVAETLAVVAPLAGKKQLLLQNHCQNQPMPLASDRRKVYQILLNLVNNAVKFSEQGTIEVSAYEDEDHWKLCVTDQGIGIKPENLPSLFQAFHQIDGSARRVYEGTGLGLYLSKKLVEMLGGQIFVSSELGKGSRFCFTLPRQFKTAGEQA
jgi:signal transduction histidine kinase